MQAEKTKPHIIVIGGGLSGLTAARQILKQKPEASVTVLEANDYLGGRTKTVMLNDCAFDLGAQFIGSYQKHAIELALQSKNQLIPVDDKGTKICDLKEGFGTYTGDIPSNVNIFALLEMQWTIFKINRMAKKVSTTDPRQCPLAYKWDSMTAQSWLEQNLSSIKTRAMVEGALRVILGVELCEVSFLYLLYYIHQSRDFQNIITVQNGLQEKKTAKGTQHMSIFLGNQISELGGQIKLNFYVKSVIQNQQKITVISETGQKIEGTYLIMAMPPPHVAKVQFNPPLSPERKTLCERTFMGTLAKVLVLYPEAYWRKKGFTGQILSDCSDGPVMNVFDDTRKNQEGKQQPALAIFIGGGVYKFWKDQPSFERVITQKLAQFFKESKMLHPITIRWNHWQEKSSIGGAPVANYPPGVLTQISDLRRPEGRIHWAGTQMATVSTGYMDGAIQSGKRAAKQIVERLANGNSANEEENKHSKTSNYPYTLYTRPNINLLNRWFEWI